MINNILERQNEEHSLELLAAQRQMYSCAKRINNGYILLSVLLPFSCSIILTFTDSSLIKSLSCLASIISLFISYIVNQKKKEIKIHAAYIQQKFDIYVYQMPWDEKLFGPNINMDGLIVKYSYEILANKKEKDKLKNWYACTIDEKDRYKWILACQRQNFWWDVGLRKKYRNYSSTAIILLCILIILIGIINNETTNDLLIRIIFILPILTCLKDIISRINDDISVLKQLDNALNNDAEKTMEDLQYIQKKIFEHRKICYAIPDAFYNLYKDNFEDKAHKAVSRMN